MKYFYVHSADIFVSRGLILLKKEHIFQVEVCENKLNFEYKAVLVIWNELKWEKNGKVSAAV